MKFSEKLQKLRKENNMSQETLADKLDVSRQSVSKWESGQTYPEMDKLLTMCKIFNITLDDLTNDEINYNEVKTKKGNTFDNLVDDVMYIIDKTFCMFTNMDPKERGKTIGELIILFIILLLFRLPFEYILHLGDSVLYYLPRGTYFFQSVWALIINIVYLILFIFTYLYIYKTYFLDKYKNEQKNTTNINTPNENENTKEEVINEAKIKEENHKIVRKKDKEIVSFTSTLFNILSKIVSFCFKVFLVFISFPFIISFIIISIILFILLVLLFKGILYFGFIITLIAAILLNWILLKLIASFIFNYKPKFKIMFTTFIIGISLIGIGTGLSIIDIANTEIIDETPKIDLEYITKTLEYKTTDNIVLENCFYNHPEYEIDESLTDSIKIEISYFKNISYFETYENKIDKFKVLEFWYNGKYNKELLNSLISNLKDKKIYNYSKLYDFEITIKSSEANINNLKNNIEEYREYNNKVSYDKNYNYYQNIIEEKNYENENLQIEISDLKEKLQELKNENENLKYKIQTYKNNLENLD